MRTINSPVNTFCLAAIIFLMFGTCFPCDAQLPVSSSAGNELSDTADIPDFHLFQEPPREYRGVRWLGFGLSNLSDSGMIRSIRSSVASDSWGSYLLGPGGGPTTGLSEAYLKASKRTPSDHGIPYSSGIAGGHFFSKYPEDAAKSLEIVEKRFRGPGTAELEVPAGIYIGAVMMNMDTFERVDVSKNLSGNNIIRCKIPKGNWNLMGFYIDSEFRPASQKGGFVDYLSREVVAKYIDLNFGPYYSHLKEYFGNVIKRTIYDEPAMHLSDGRMWTPLFNAEFEKKYHYSPMIYHPALWYYIGQETSAARNALFGFRAELFADNYIGQMAEWCASHGIKLSGHMDQEETRNPVGVNGDLMNHHVNTPVY